MAFGIHRLFQNYPLKSFKNDPKASFATTILDLLCLCIATSFTAKICFTLQSVLHFKVHKQQHQNFQTVLKDFKTKRWASSDIFHLKSLKRLSLNPRSPNAMVNNVIIFKL